MDALTSERGVVERPAVKRVARVKVAEAVEVSEKAAKPVASTAGAVQLGLWG